MRFIVEISPEEMMELIPKAMQPEMLQKMTMAYMESIFNRNPFFTNMYGSKEIENRRK